MEPELELGCPSGPTALLLPFVSVGPCVEFVGALVAVVWPTTGATVAASRCLRRYACFL